MEQFSIARDETSLYFKKFIEAYRAQHIPIEMVVPQIAGKTG